MPIEIPKIMRTLERDKRGYPIPVVVLRDRQRKPLFTRNDHTALMACAKKRLCSICGKKLAEPWFVAGSRAFLSPYGVFVDPPTHFECAEYALQVCPFLAAPNYSKSIVRNLSPEQLGDNKVLIEQKEEFVGPTQPELFGLGMAKEYDFRTNSGGLFRYSVADWRHVEFWRNGQPQPAPSAAKVAELLSVKPLIGI